MLSGHHRNRLMGGGGPDPRPLATMRWAFNETTGLITRDTAIAATQTATLQGTQSFADLGNGERGIESLNQNGMGVTGTDIICPVLSPWTIIAHVYLDSFSNNSLPMIGRFKTGLVNNPFSIGFGTFSSVYYGIFIGRDSGVTSLRTDFTLAQAQALAGGWRYVLVDFDGVGGFCVELENINQPLVARGNLTQGPDVTTIVGSDTSYAGFTQWDGRMNFIERYPRKLTTEEKTARYNLRGNPI